MNNEIPADHEARNVNPNFVQISDANSSVRSIEHEVFENTVLAENLSAVFQSKTSIFDLPHEIIKDNIVKCLSNDDYINLQVALHKYDITLSSLKGMDSSLQGNIKGDLRNTYTWRALRKVFDSLSKDQFSLLYFTNISKVLDNQTEAIISHEKEGPFTQEEFNHLEDFFNTLTTVAQKENIEVIKDDIQGRYDIKLQKTSSHKPENVKLATEDYISNSELLNMLHKVCWLSGKVGKACSAVFITKMLSQQPALVARRSEFETMTTVVGEIICLKKD